MVVGNLLGSGSSKSMRKLWALPITELSRSWHFAFFLSVFWRCKSIVGDCCCPVGIVDYKNIWERCTNVPIWKWRRITTSGVLSGNGIPHSSRIYFYAGLLPSHCVFCWCSVLSYWWYPEAMCFVVSLMLAFGILFDAFETVWSYIVFSAATKSLVVSPAPGGGVTDRVLPCADILLENDQTADRNVCRASRNVGPAATMWSSTRNTEMSRKPERSCEHCCAVVQM